MELSWLAAETTDFESLKGFRVYRDSALLTTENINELYFIDVVEDSGIYLYGVVAIYELGMSKPAEINVIVPVSESDIELPFMTELLGNYPNPFNPSTTITFNVGRDAFMLSASSQEDTHIRIDIFNIRGQKVRTLTDEAYAPGRYSVVWNGTDENGRFVGNGIYFYQMKTKDAIYTRKMILLK